MSVLFQAGSSQRVTLPISNISQNRAGFSAFGIIRPSSVPSSTQRRIFQISVNGSTTNSRVSLDHAEFGGGGFLRAFSRRLDGDSGVMADSGGGTIVANTTYSVGIVCNWSSFSLISYIDGAQAAFTGEGSWSGNSSNTTPGSQNIAARGDAAQFFDGEIEALMWWPVALPANIMQALHATRGALPNAAALAGNLPVAHWPMRGQLPVAPSTLPDVWGTLDGTTVNGPTYQGFLGDDPFGGKEAD